MWPEEVDFGVGADLAAPDYIFPVRQVIPHPDYVGERPQDVAVLVLGERVSEVAVDVEPLPVLTAEPSSGLEGATAEVVGVGVTELSEYNTQQYWTTEVLKTVTSDLLLVDGEGRTGLCFGDSGGPILLPLDGGPPTVLGVLSAGDESCAGEDEFAPLVLAREILEPVLESPEFCSSLGDAGRCQGDIAQWCEGGRPQQECCSFGCEQDQQGRYRCRSEDDLCAELGSGAACVAGQLVSCAGGTATRLVCAACGAGVCEEHDGTASCIAP